MRRQAWFGLERASLPGSAVVAALAWLVPSPALGQVQITHASVDCVVAGEYPVIEADLQPPGEVTQARVYFRARGTPHWYSVDMKGAGGAAFQGILPRPLASLGGLDYYIETLGSGLTQGRSQEYTADIISGSETCPSGLRKATVMSSVPSALIVHAPEGATALPAGFAPTGLVTTAGGAGAGAAVGGGISKGLLIGIGAAAGAAGVAVAVGGGGDGGDGADSPAGGAPPGGTPEPTPTPPPTTDVSGRWLGTFNENPSTTQCSVQNDLSLDLQQDGNAVTGTFQLTVLVATPAPADPCPVAAGESFGGPLSGVVNGDVIELQLQITGGPSFFLGGTVSGDRMGGSSPPDEGGPGGEWEVFRQL
jgi:hypothetical protein